MAKLVAVDACRSQGLHTLGDGALPTAAHPRQTNHKGYSWEMGHVLSQEGPGIYGKGVYEMASLERFRLLPNSCIHQNMLNRDGTKGWYERLVWAYFWGSEEGA